jgi:hypothetical protein
MARSPKSQSTKTLRSPRDLVGITSRALAEGENLGQTGSNQARIAFLKNWAATAIRSDGKDPQKYLEIIDDSAKADRGYVAALVFRRLSDIEQDLKVLDRLSDLEAIRQFSLHVIHHALALASEFRALTIVDNEMSLATGAKVLGGLETRRTIVNAKLHSVRYREWKKWNNEANKIWVRQPQLSRQAVAALVKRNLRLAEAVRTVAKRLTMKGG